MQVLKIQPQTFKSSYIKLIALVFSLVMSLLLSIISLVLSRSPTSFNLNALRIGIYTAIGIFGVVYLTTAIIYILIRNIREDCKCLKVTWLVDSAYIFGGLLYYAGRNLPFPVAQPILLGMVVVFYRFIPFFISKYYQSNLAKEHQTTEAKLQLVPEWILAAESLTLLVEFDALYTVIINPFFQFPVFTCRSAAPLIGAWVMWTLLVLMYILILYYTMNIQYCGICNVNKSCIISNLCATILCVAFGMYLLSNNRLPLICSINPINLFVPQIILKVLVLIVVITAIVLLLVYRCMSKTRQEKLLPRALYQHLHLEPDVLNDLPLETIVRVGDEEKKQPDA